MWEQYGILGIDKAHGTSDEGDGLLRERILDFANMQCDGEVDYYNLQPVEANINDYMLLTDNDGGAFIHEAAVYYRDNIGSELVSLVGGISNQIDSYEALDGSNNADKLISDGSNALKNPDSVSKDNSYEEVEIKEPNLSPEQIEKGEKVLDDVSAFKSKGVLEQVIPNDKEISDKSFDLENSVSNRSLQQGNSRNSSKATAVDKVVFSIYLRDKFQHFGKDLGHSGQAYELEYIISGNNNDTDNLKGVVGRLLAIRTAADFLTLCGDKAREAEALELAVALAGITVNPVIIEGVKYALMAAWSYLEAVLDVRLLLDGGKVSPIKTSAEWTSDLYNLGSCMDANYTAKDSGSGMNYEDYLLAFLVIESSKKESLRALDMIEASMNSIPYYENLKMDHLVCDMNMMIEYEADPMFFSLVTLEVPFLDFYHLKKKEYRSYL